MTSLFQKIFVAISIIFALLVLIYFLSGLILARQKNAETGQFLLNKLFVDYFTQQSGASFIETARPFTDQQRTRLLALYSPGAGIIELWTVSENYLREDPASETSFSYNSISEELLTVRDPSSDYQASTVFRVLSNKDLRPILIRTLYLILGYTLFTVLILCIRGISRKVYAGNSTVLSSPALPLVRGGRRGSGFQN